MSKKSESLLNWISYFHENSGNEFKQFPLQQEYKAKMLSRQSYVLFCMLSWEMYVLMEPTSITSQQIFEHPSQLIMNVSIDNCDTLRLNLSVLNYSLTSTDEPICLDHAPTLSKSGIVRVLVLSAMAFVSLLGNIATMWNIRKNRTSRRMFRHNCSAIYTLIFHLSVSDILVTFFCIIGEAAWSYVSIYSTVRCW